MGLDEFISDHSDTKMDTFAKDNVDSHHPKIETILRAKYDEVYRLSEVIKIRYPIVYNVGRGISIVFLALLLIGIVGILIMIVRRAHTRELVYIIWAVVFGVCLWLAVTKMGVV